MSLLGFSDSRRSVCVGQSYVYDDCDCTVLCVYDQMPLNFRVVERTTCGIINGQRSGGNFMGFLFVPAFEMGEGDFGHELPIWWVRKSTRLFAYMSRILKMQPI